MLRRCCVCLGFILSLNVSQAGGAETLWIEAEHLDGIKGYCWPMGTPAMKKTAGHWALSGPGWAAEWNQGGESGFLSIACGADDDKAVATKTIEIPVEGTYAVWVRYGDWREKTERFQVQLEQPGMQPWTGRYGEQAVIEEDNEMKLYWGWAFGWDRRDVNLKKGPAKLSLMSTTKDPEPRQVDVIVLTTDLTYRPRIKDRPKNDTWTLLDTYRKSVPDNLEPLTRTRPGFDLPAAWKLRTFNDQGFRYLWNVGADKSAKWLSDDPNRVLYPYQVADDDVRAEFEKKYGGQKEVPIFADPRVVPTFHGVGPIIFATDPKTGELLEPGQRFAKWLDQHPERSWGTMMNYAGNRAIGPKGIEQFQKYRSRYVGAISGENLGYFNVDGKKIQEEAGKVTTRRQLAEVIARLSLEANAAKYREVYGKDLDANAYQDVIACLSVGNIVFMPLCCDWGARTVGYESSAATSSLLSMRWAFMRGLARQHGALTATYRSCNFGDSSTIFSKQQSFTSPRNLLDNYYSVFAGAGMTWYKFDIWYQYQAGASMFYHEQGFDEFWKPGGTTVAGIKEVQLSPKGQLVDRFLRLTAQEPDRGVPYTPIAFLVDYAHGWEPAPFWPNSFKNFHQQQERFRFGVHEKMLEEYFWTAFHPIGPESTKPMTGTNEVNVPGVFGDIFDVICAYPDVKKWRTIDTYPVVIAAGEIELTDAEGKRLAQYVEQGGTLLVADEHLTGPGAAALQLPKTGVPAEAEGYQWLGEEAVSPSPRYRYRPIEGGRALATTPDGKVFCAAVDRGKGRLIYLSVPRGMSITHQAVPALARLYAHLSRGLMPVDVKGEVEWLVSRTNKGWLVTLLNPAGQAKPQQGITPTDYRENRMVTIRSRLPVKDARDRLLPSATFPVRDNTVECEVPAGGVRIIELR
ncbi:hypothetical protein AYO44_02745 [Planctomycetaceae bacterium SCGC AG-212-F19]|nr:hypothetical protein AYO44_02745 [Planctomycetaceae bacterium SCGC AG-212-F19]